MSQYIRVLVEAATRFLCERRPSQAFGNTALRTRLFSSDKKGCGSEEVAKPCDSGQTEQPCPEVDKDSCNYKDANKRLKAKPEPCPPRKMDPKLPPWCLEPHLKDLGKRVIKEEVDPCGDGAHKCPHDEGVSYRKHILQEKNDPKGTMKQKLKDIKTLDKEWGKAKIKYAKDNYKDSFCCEKGKGKKKK